MKSIYRVVVSISVLALAMSSLLTFANAAEAKTVTNGDWEITWGGGAASVRNLKTGEKKVLFESLVAKSEEDGQSTYEVLSVVGTIISYSNSWYFEGGAHPSYGTTWSSVDLESPSTNLVALFGEQPVYERLMREPLVQSAIAGVLAERDAQPMPTNWKELVERADGGCFASMGDSLLTDYHFAYRLGGTLVAVQIGLTHGCEVNRGSFTKLGMLYFPIPDQSKADFDRAVKDGVLEDRPFQKTSFNCAKAGTAIEFAICTDAAVAKLDVAMAKQYKAARQAAAGEAKQKIKKDQWAWIETRDRECAAPTNEMLYDGNGEFFATIEACLVKYYENRLAALK